MRGGGRPTDLNHRPDSGRFDNCLDYVARHRADVREGAWSRAVGTYASGSGKDGPTPAVERSLPREPFVPKGGLGHREVRVVPPRAPGVGEGRGARGFVDMIGT